MWSQFLPVVLTDFANSYSVPVCISTGQWSISFGREKCILNNGVRHFLLRRILHYRSSCSSDLYELHVQRYLLADERNSGRVWRFVIFIPYTRCRRWRHLLFRQSKARKFWSSCGLKRALKPHFLKYREVHYAEFIVSIHEIVGLIGTNIVCWRKVCIGTSKWFSH